jgi:hypothetical protein
MDFLSIGHDSFISFRNICFVSSQSLTYYMPFAENV